MSWLGADEYYDGYDKNGLYVGDSLSKSSKPAHLPIKKSNQYRVKVAIVGCVHGNETIGLDVINDLDKIKFDGIDLDCIVANHQAISQNTRFFQEDLNRCFPGSFTGNYEERIAAQLIEYLRKYDYVVDIHSTTAKTDNFVIVTQDSEEVMRLASYVPLKKIVRVEPAISNGKALIDHVRNGISIEFDETTNRGLATGIIVGCISNILNSAPYENQEVYSVYGVMKGDRTRPLDNFKDHVMHGETFYPVLSGEAAYKDLLCLKARKIEDGGK